MAVQPRLQIVRRLLRQLPALARRALHPRARLRRPLLGADGEERQLRRRRPRACRPVIVAGGAVGRGVGGQHEVLVRETPLLGFRRRVAAAARAVARHDALLLPRDARRARVHVVMLVLVLLLLILLLLMRVLRQRMPQTLLILDRRARPVLRGARARARGGRVPAGAAVVRLWGDAVRAGEVLGGGHGRVEARRGRVRGRRGRRQARGVRGGGRLVAVRVRDAELLRVRRCARAAGCVRVRLGVLGVGGGELVRGEG